MVDLLAKTSLNSTAVLGLLSGWEFPFLWLYLLFSSSRWLGFGDVKFIWFLGLAVPFPLIFVNVFGIYDRCSSRNFLLIMKQGSFK